jgi:HEAT repeat protein
MEKSIFLSISRLFALTVLICTSGELLGSGVAPFLEKNPELRDRLLQWEREAPDEVVELIRALRSKDGLARGRAASHLGAISSRAKGAILALTEMASDRTALQWVPDGLNTTPGVEAVRTLVRIGDPSNDVFIAAMNSGDPGARRMVQLSFNTLVDLDDFRYMEPFLEAATKDKEPEFRKNAARILGMVRDPRMVRALLPLARDQDWGVRVTAVLALEQYPCPAVVDAIKAALTDANAEVRGRSASALGSLNAVSAFDGLVRSLKDPVARVRENSAFALANIKDARAVSPLIVALRDKDKTVRRAVVFALQKITGRDFGEDPEKWLAGTK